MIKPLGVHVLLEPLDKGGLIELPAGSKGQADKAIVRGIGARVDMDDLKVGDTVIFRKYSPDEFMLDGKEVYLIEEQDLMGIYEECTQDNESETA